MTQSSEKLKPGEIIPSEAAPLRALTVTMTVMCYLACLAIGALILINAAVKNWTGSLSREVTVQVRTLQARDLESDVLSATKLLQETPGVLTVRVLDKKDSAKLLEPWLGSIGLDELPVPRLLRVTLDSDHPPDFPTLEASLNTAIPSATLDTHRHWEAELTRMARALSTLSYAILLLICLSTMAMVVFATRTVLDANRQVVDVLHLVGASDRYISRQINNRFLRTGLMAGLIGVFLGLATFFLLSLSGIAGNSGVAAASQGLLFAPPKVALWNYAALLCVPLVTTVICLITSRLALMRMLEHVL